MLLYCVRACICFVCSEDSIQVCCYIAYVRVFVLSVLKIRSKYVAILRTCVYLFCEFWRFDPSMLLYCVRACICFVCSEDSIQVCCYIAYVRVFVLSVLKIRSKYVAILRTLKYLFCEFWRDKSRMLLYCVRACIYVVSSEDSIQVCCYIAYVRVFVLWVLTGRITHVAILRTCVYLFVF